MYNTYFLNNLQTVYITSHKYFYNYQKEIL